MRIARQKNYSTTVYLRGKWAKRYRWRLRCQLRCQRRAIQLHKPKSIKQRLVLGTGLHHRRPTLLVLGHHHPHLHYTKLVLLTLTLTLMLLLHRLVLQLAALQLQFADCTLMLLCRQTLENLILLC